MFHILGTTIVKERQPMLAKLFTVRVCEYVRFETEKQVKMRQIRHGEISLYSKAVFLL